MKEPCYVGQPIVGRLTCSNGTIQYKWICQHCDDYRTNPVKAATLTAEQKANAPEIPNYDDYEERKAKRRPCPYNAEAEQARIDRIAAYKNRDVVAHEEGFWAKYDRHLQSDAWFETRAQKFAEAGEPALCQAGAWAVCVYRDGERAEAVDCHHRHYKTLGREQMRDLMLLCRACHDFCTAHARRLREEDFGPER